MKKLLLLPLVLLVTPLLAQRVEFSDRAGLGLLRFGGPGATSSALVINRTNDLKAPDNYTVNPFGTEAGAGAGASIRAQCVGRRGQLAALEVGYDWLQSRAAVGGYYPFYDTGFAPAAATGIARLRWQAVPVFVGIGQRFGQKSAAVQLDAVVGPELAFTLDTRERGAGTYGPSGSGWQTNTPRQLAQPRDFRLRVDLTAWYRSLGLMASYALGLTANHTDVPYPGGGAHARVLRLDVAYRLR